MNFYSLEKEIAQGRELAQQFEQQAKILEDVPVTAYVNRVAQRIALNSDVQFPIAVKVVENDTANATMLPGGFLYVNTGLLLKTESEAELAGALAHAIAHVAARHGTRLETTGQIANQAALPRIFMGGGYAAAADRQPPPIPVGFLRFSREFEKEADALGLQYLYRTGYDPAAYISLLAKTPIEQVTSGADARAFSSHPAPSDRIAGARQAITGLEPRPDYVVTTTEFAAAKARLEGR
jgi:predicted Zn-dependent protease